jgi:chemosensory pili system protein ChpA (sensor histidine kinase/response regulator)
VSRQCSRPCRRCRRRAAERRNVADFGDDQDDIDIVDAIDPDLFPIFEEEAIELMPQLGGALRPVDGAAR